MVKRGEEIREVDREVGLTVATGNERRGTSLVGPSQTCRTEFNASAVTYGCHLSHVMLKHWSEQRHSFQRSQTAGDYNKYSVIGSNKVNSEINIEAELIDVCRGIVIGAELVVVLGGC